MTHFEFEQKAFDGINLYFQGWQTEQNPKGSICLVHGLGEHSGRYTYWAELLNKAGYSVISYDLRGHGKSEGQRGHVDSFEDYLKDTDVLLGEANKRYTGVPRFLYGHSMGALIVTDYVLVRIPQLNGVIVTALPIQAALQKQKVKIFLSKVLGTLVPKMTIASGLAPATISKDPEVVTKYVNDPLVHNKVTTGWGKSSLETITWVSQHAKEWRLPVLFMHGEDDQLAYKEGCEEIACKIEGDCTVKIWPGLLHEVHNEPEKQEVFDFLHKWLDAHTQG
jgi:acylglycerol lipase